MAECVDDVTAWLDKLGLPEYTENFLSAGYYTLQQCATLSKADLTAIGIIKLGHVHRLDRDLKRMKENGELGGASSTPDSLSSTVPNGVTLSTSSGQQSNAAPKHWNNPFRRLATFLKQTKCNISSVTSSHKTHHHKVKPSELDEDSPGLLQRTWSLRKNITERGKFFRRHSMRVTRAEVNRADVTNSVKFRDVMYKPVVPSVNSNGQPPSGDTLATVHKDSSDSTPPPPLPPKQLSPPPLPPRAPTDPVPLLPVRSVSIKEDRDETKSSMPVESPPQLPVKKTVKAASAGDRTHCKSNVYERPRLMSLRDTESTGKKLCTVSQKEKEKQLTLPAKLVHPLKDIDVPCNGKQILGSLTSVSKKQKSMPSSSFPQCNGHSDIQPKNHTRGSFVVKDKFVSIRSDNSSEGISIFVSEPHCAGDTSEEEDEYDEYASLDPHASLQDILISSKETIGMSSNDTRNKSLDNINNSSTVQNPPRPSPLELKKQQITSSFLDAPLSAPPVGVTDPSLMNCPSSNGMSVLCNGITSMYSQLELPEEIKQQEKVNYDAEIHSSENYGDLMRIKKRFKIKHPFLVRKIRRRVEGIIRSSEIQNVRCITEPYCAIEIEGAKTVVDHVEPKIFSSIVHLENNITSSTLHFVDTFARPALNSPEMIQLCDELCDELDISLKVQLQPKILSTSVAVTFSKSNVIVQMYEGDIALDTCHTYINFTDGNFTMSNEVKAMCTQVELDACTQHVNHYGPGTPGRAFNFGTDMSRSTTIIHAVMPQWQDGNSGECGLITTAVIESLRLAEKCEVTSISLPFLSCVDSCLPLDILAESCLAAVHIFAVHSEHIKMVRLILPVNMAKKFLDKFTTGVFKQFVISDEPDVTNPDSIKEFCDLGDSAWLWEDDHCKYNYFQPKDNKLLNKESAICFNASCDLNIGPSIFRVYFKDMIQINLSTKCARKVKCIPLGSVWQFRNRAGEWEQYSPQVTLMIEAMYSTGNDHDLILSDGAYSYDFKQMVQLNVDTKETTGIRRIDSAAVCNDVCNMAKSKITIMGSAQDVNTVEDKILQCFKSLVAIHNVDIQRKFIPAVEKCIKRTQRSNTVKVVKMSETDLIAKYSVTGYGNCVQQAAIELYKVTAMASCSVQKPREWELQSQPIVLIDILKGSPEWSKICARMGTTLKCNVLSIKRIQNEFLWEKYVQHKELMSHKGPQSMTEIELFHGTRSNPPKCIYESEEGFDMRYSREGLWGLGNYFAENANYASCFAYNKFNEVLQLFFVKVLVGDSCEILPDSNLRMPPFKYDSKVRYDTVNGHSKGSRVYITYSNDKAYPFYLISYTIEQ